MESKCCFWFSHLHKTKMSHLFSHRCYHSVHCFMWRYENIHKTGVVLFFPFWHQWSEFRLRYKWWFLMIFKTGSSILSHFHLSLYNFKLNQVKIYPMQILRLYNLSLIQTLPPSFTVYFYNCSLLLLVAVNLRSIVRINFLLSK